VQDLSGIENRTLLSGSFESRLKELQDALTNSDYQAVFVLAVAMQCGVAEQIKTARIKKPKVFCRSVI